jgi:hypothetical protein
MPRQRSEAQISLRMVRRVRFLAPGGKDASTHLPPTVVRPRTPHHLGPSKASSPGWLHRVGRARLRLPRTPGSAGPSACEARESKDERQGNDQQPGTPMSESLSSEGGEELQGPIPELGPMEVGGARTSSPTVPLPTGPGRTCNQGSSWMEIQKWRARLSLVGRPSGSIRIR